MGMAEWVLLAGVVVLAAVVLDRAFLWMERRGWIFWRKRRASAGAASGAAFEVAALFQPTQHVVVEERARRDAGVVEANGEGDGRS